MFKISTHLQRAIDGFSGLWFRALPVMIVMFLIFMVQSLGWHFGSTFVDFLMCLLYMLLSLYFVMVIVKMALSNAEGGKCSLKESLHVGLKTFLYAFLAAIIYYAVIWAFGYCAKQIMLLKSVSGYFSWTLISVTALFTALMLAHYPLLLINLQREGTSLKSALCQSWKMFRSCWEEVSMRVAVYVFLAIIFTMGAASMVFGIIASLLNLLMGNAVIGLADSIVWSLYFVLLLAPFSVVFYTQLYLDLKSKSAK